MKLKNKREINFLAFLLSATYMVSYITRINYGAVVSAMVETTGYSKSLLSLALTGSFITYGVGQIVSGVLGDRVSPKKLVSYGLVVTVLMNFMIPICKNPYYMCLIWCINGFAQSFMWPPMVKIMVMLLSEDDYKKTSTKVSWGSSFGTIAVYLVSPVLISTFGWESVFCFSAICGIIMILVWNKFCYSGNLITPEKEKKSVQKNSLLFTPVMCGVMIAIILQGMLRDGITTWMPSYISETYNISNVISILSGVVLPIFSIVSFQVATYLYINNITNPLKCAGFFFCIGTITAGLLTMISGNNAAQSVLLSALLTGCMHGVNLILICMVPPFFNKNGNVSTVSGVINSCTYIGSAISTYGIAFLSDKYGWKFTLISWVLTALMGAIICLLCAKPFEIKYMNGKEENEL